MLVETNHYLPDQKEKFLHSLQTPCSDNNYNSGILKEELNYIAGGQTTPDFLEILHGRSLISLLLRIGECIPTINSTVVMDHQVSSFQEARSRKFGQFITYLEAMVDNQQFHPQVGNFIRSKRKYLGMAHTIPDLQRLAQIMSYIGNLGLLEDDKIGVIHYFGSFNPFPHKGHVEIARQAYEVIDPYTRIVPTTTLNNPTKLELADSLEERLQALHEGFFDDEYVSVVGLVGDFNDRKHRIYQLALLGSFDYERRLRFLMGSDMLIKRVDEALKDDEYAQFVLREGNLLYVSPRNGENSDAFSKALNTVRSTFKPEVVLLPKPQYSLSGTFIRTLPLEKRLIYKQNSLE